MKRIRSFKSMCTCDDKGFTLLDAMIAMFVFGFGILALVRLQTTSIEANMMARQTTEAASHAASVVENFRPLDYLRDAELTDGTHTELADMDRYSFTYNVQRDSILDNTMLINITVNWTEKGVQKSVNLIAIKPDII